MKNIILLLLVTLIFMFSSCKKDKQEPLITKDIINGVAQKGPFLNDLFRFIGRFIQFLTVSMALSLSNAVAVIEGYLGIKSSFVRTPKFNVLIKTEFKGNKYDKKSLSLINILEGLLMLVFGFTAVQRAVYGDLGMVPFHLMLTCGYGIIFFSTLKENRSQG